MTDFETKEMGSDMWWQIVMSSQMYEAEALLKQFKAALLAKHADAPTYNDAAAQITRVNSELHRFAQIQNRAKLSIAVRNICGDDVYRQVMEEAARLEADARCAMGVPAC
jgi:hypothetical protein